MFKFGQQKKKRESRSLANNTIPVLCMYYIYKQIYSYYSDIYKNIFTAPSRLNTDIKHTDIKPSASEKSQDCI